MTMRSIEEFPPADYPLMEKLPALKPETIANLVRWAAAQGDMSVDNAQWLACRASDYDDRFESQLVSDEKRTRFRIEMLAYAALDLLRWRTGGADNRGAVEHLNLPLAKQEVQPRINTDEHK